MLRRQREYYVGGRPGRRRGGRFALVALAIVAIGAGTAFAAFVPAMGLTPPSTIAPALPTSAALGSQTAGPATTTAPSVVPASTGPDPSTGPVVTPSPPCRPPENLEPAKVVSHGSREKKVIALTFDDGTNPENTKQILRILKQYKVNATFFPTGRSLERFPDVWKLIAKSHYPIANHTYAHIELDGLCFQAQLREMEQSQKILAGLGIKELPVFRPPYELFDETTQAAAAASGLEAVVLWGVDTRDWQGASIATIRSVALSGNKGSIVLMHTFPEATAAALPAIIKGYKARGFEFVTIGQLLGIDGAVPFPPKAATNN